MHLQGHTRVFTPHLLAINTVQSFAHPLLMLGICLEKVQNSRIWKHAPKFKPNLFFFFPSVYFPQLFFGVQQCYQHSSCPWEHTYSFVPSFAGCITKFQTAPSLLRWAHISSPPRWCSPSLFYLSLSLTYILQWMSAVVLAHFSKAVRPHGFAGADAEALDRFSIQMDRRLPALPQALYHRCLFPVVWPQGLFCCKTKRTVWISDVYFKSPLPIVHFSLSPSAQCESPLSPHNACHHAGLPLKLCKLLMCFYLNFTKTILSCKLIDYYWFGWSMSLHGRQAWKIETNLIIK